VIGKQRMNMVAGRLKIYPNHLYLDLGCRGGIKVRPKETDVQKSWISDSVQMVQEVMYDQNWLVDLHDRSWRSAAQSGYQNHYLSSEARP
jgi:hypothetical protein